MDARKPLLEMRMGEAGLSGYALAKLAGVTQTHVHRARHRTLGPDNAEKVAGALTRKLDLPGRDRLLLKAEIMGRPGALAYAYFGSADAVQLEFGVIRAVALQILNAGRTINGNAAEAIRERLARGDVPSCVAEDVRSRIGPPPAGKVTRSGSGPAVSEGWSRTLDAFERGKPNTAKALRESGLKRVELRTRAGIGKETLRRALYEKAGPDAARKLSEVLAATAGLSEYDREAVRGELGRPPKKV